MATAESYVQEAWRLVCRLFPEGKVTVQWITAAEGRAQKRALAQLQRELRLVKKQIATEKRLVTSELTSRRIMVGKSLGANLAAGFFGRRRVGTFNAIRRNDLQ